MAAQPVPGRQTSGSISASVPDGATEAVRVSVIVCAYNEERNLPGLLAAVLEQSSPEFGLFELIVVASGCTDGTVAIAQAAAARDQRVRVIVQPERRGKAAAMRAGLAAAAGDILVVENADTLPAPGAFDRMVRPFADARVGLVCCRIEPVVDAPGPTGRIAAVMWRVHDEVSTREPKAGEAFALRRMPFELPEDIEDDDTYLGFYPAERGYRSAYARDAVIFNHPPTVLPDLLRQRARIDRQVVGLRRRTGHTSNTWEFGVLGRAIAGYLRRHPSDLGWVMAMGMIEAAVRVGVLLSAPFRRGPLRVWAPVASTKGQIGSPAEPSGGVRGATGPGPR